MTLEHPSMQDEMAALRAELTRLRAEVERLGAAEHAASGARSTRRGEPAEEVASRRGLLKLAGSAAVATAATAAVIGRATPVAASNGDTVQIANNTVASSGAVISTFLNYSATTSNASNRHLFVVGDAAAAFNPTGSTTAAVAGHASQRVQIGVSGNATISGGKGVLGTATTGTGVTGESGSGWDFLAGGTGRVYLTQAVTVGPPTVGSYSGGEIIRDGQSDLWICAAGGSNSRWRKIGGATTAGALHIIEPTRVYDSRLSGGVMGTGQRMVSVANGIDLNTGAVNAANVVPDGATAIQFTLTVTGATGSGFMSVTPGDASTYKASTINWSPTTPSLATGALVKIDTGRSVKVFVGGGGSTQFIIDVTGYYR